MFTKFIETYGNIQNKIDIPSTDLEAFKSNLHEDIYSLLTNGAGSYMNGYFWTVNPKEYKDILDEVYIPLKKPSVCFARDAFANLYVWEDNTVYYLNLRHNKWKVIGRKPKVLFDGIMTDWNYFSKQVVGEKYSLAKKHLGNLAFDECYGYFPLLSLGGAEKVENLKKVKIREHISIIAQMQGKIQ